MKYSGKIVDIKQIIVSDPSYAKNVWCRYENDNLNAQNWNVNIDISKYNERVDGYDLEGIEFTMLLSNPNVRCRLTDNGVAYPKSNIVDEYTIGMDTACVSLGINEFADKIRDEIDEWQPSTCLKTLTDGEFGTVFEGKNPNNLEVNFISITGYFDEDTGYSIDSVMDYLKESFQIESLSLDMENSEEQSEITMKNI